MSDSTTALSVYRAKPIRIGSTGEGFRPLKLDESLFAEAMERARQQVRQFERSLGIPKRLIGDVAPPRSLYWLDG